MKPLKIFLGLIYIILLLLLLLLGLKTCRNNNIEPPRIEEPQEVQDSVPEVPVDTASLIREAEEVDSNGDLRITLMWDFLSDIDLHVIEPSGEEIFYDHLRSRSGGRLNRDNLRGGEGAAENVYWENPPKGQYKVSVVYYKANTPVPAQGDCNIVVFKRGCEPEYHNVKVTTPDSSKKIIVTDVVIEN